MKIQFLDLTDIDESELNHLQQVLYTVSPSVKLPWEVHTDYPCSSEYGSSPYAVAPLALRGVFLPQPLYSAAPAAVPVGLVPSVAGKKMSFTEEMEEKLIEEVRMHPVLYNLNHKNYKNNVVKDNIWKQIALKLDRTEKECKTRWRSIRDTYRKIKIKEKYKTGSTAPSKSKYNTAKFAFFDVALQERKTVSLREKNVNEHESRHSDEEEYEKQKEELGTEENEEEEEELNFHEEIIHIGEVDGHGNPSHKTRKAILKDQALDELKKGREDRMAIMKELLAVKSEERKEDHPVTDFFKSMAKTVMEFSPELIAETRMKVCQIVTEMEMRHLYQQRTTSSMTTFSTTNNVEDNSKLSTGTSSAQDEVSFALSQCINLP